MIDLRRSPDVEVRVDAASVRVAEQHPDLALASAWIAGELAPDRAAEARERYDADPAFRDLVHPVALSWRLASELPADAPRVDELRAPWNDFRRRAELPALGVPATGVDVLVHDLAARRRHVVQLRRLVGLAAAAVLLALGVDRAIPLLFTPSRGVEITRESRDQSLTFSLPENSRVTLAPASHLRFEDTDFRFGPRREVWLEGEATFVVAPHLTALKRQFVVHTRAATITVEGTIFTVHQYPGDPSAHVEVIDGEVSVTSTTDNRTVRLHPGQSLTVMGPTKR